MALTEIQTHTLSREAKLHLNRDLAVATDSHHKASDKVRAIDTFIKKWKGCLHDIDPDQEKYLYLQEKHG